MCEFCGCGLRRLPSSRGEQEQTKPAREPRSVPTMAFDAGREEPSTVSAPPGKDEHPTAEPAVADREAANRRT